MTISAIQFPGSMSITNRFLMDASSDEVQDAAPQFNLDVYYDVSGRTAVDATKSDIVYYIQADANLNDCVLYTADASGVAADDLWGFLSITVNHQDASHATFNLPTANGVDLFIKHVSLYALTGTSLDVYNNGGSSFKTFQYQKDSGAAVDVSATGLFYDRAFDIYSSITTNTSGQITGAPTAFRTDGTFTDLNISVAEDMTLAQVVGISYHEGLPFYGTPTETTSDRLTYTLNKNFLDTNAVLSAKLTNVEELYKYKNGTGEGVDASLNNILDSWSISFDGEPKSDTSTIAKHARYSGAAWQTNTDWFSGQKIVANTAHSLSVSIIDGSGNSTTIIPAADVWGVLRHNADISNIAQGYTLAQP